MKRLFIIFAVFVGLAFMVACEKEQENPVLDLNDIVPAELLSPQSGGDYVLLQEEAEDTLFNISWNAADYVMEDILPPRYAIEVDIDGNDFAAPATVATLDDLDYDLIVNRLNDVSGTLGLEPDVSSEVNMRIRSFIPDTSDDLMQYSNHVTFSITPFEFAVPPIYILGDGTPPGWDNTGALEMEHVEEATYAIVVDLGAGFLKFISVLGQWAPQWGTDDNPPAVEDDGTIVGNLVYRPTEAEPDPEAIPVPEEPGSYRVVADTIGLQYRIEPTAEKVYVIGDVTEAGWNISAAVEMTKTAPGKFYTLLELDGTEGLSLQFADGQTNQATRWGSASDYAHARSKMVESNNRKVQLPAKAGTYKLEVNLATQNYRLIKQ